jgi:hypothetical protein
MAIEFITGQKVAPSGLNGANSTATGDVVWEGALASPTNSGIKPEQLRLGYLLITSPQPNVLMGSVMVTDGRGLPVAFYYTNPIKPSKIQQVLYGPSLNQYLKTDVILETLLGQLEDLPSVLFVEDDALLQADLNSVLSNAGKHRRGVGATVPCLLRMASSNGDPIGPVGQVEIPGTLDNPSLCERLLQQTRDGGPLRLTSGIVDNAGFSWDTILQTLACVAPSVILTEPFRRIEKALELLSLNDHTAD